MTYNYLPSNLPSILRAAGLTVVEIEGWQKRGRPASVGSFNPVGVLCHHTGSYDKLADAPDDLSYAKWLAITGRSDLAAPLCQLALSAEGVVYICAAGRANHAGKAKASGTVAAGDGNSLYIGIEAMNDGKQGWGKKQYDAYVKLCAVLSLKITKNSANTVRAHKETSSTGKWDPGLLDMDKFRGDVAAEMRRMSAAAQRSPKPVTLSLGHASMQFSDTRPQVRSDADKIFSRGYDWITGTEAGENPVLAVLKAEAESTGYDFHQYKSNWVAVKKSLAKNGKFEHGAKTIVDNDDVIGPGHDLNVVWVTFTHATLGKISVLSSHYATKGRPDGKGIYTRNLESNKRLAKAIGEIARELGKGSALVFYGGDQNIVDRHNDTFFGQPLTSAWDELKVYENTGHGNIDVIASYDADVRVKAKSARALDDNELPLHTDHYLIEATYAVAPL